MAKKTKPMTLKEYFDEYKVSVNRFCRNNNLNYFTVRKVVLGFDCLLSTAIIIEEATKGLVTCQSLRPSQIKPVRERLQRLHANQKNIDAKSDSTNSHEDENPK